MKRRPILIIGLLIIFVYTTSLCGCTQKNSEIGSEPVAIGPDGSALDESDTESSEISEKEPVKDPYEYLDPAIEILGWKFVNNVAASKALELIDQAIEIDDSIAQAYKYRACAYLCLGDSIANFDSAESDFIKVQELEPDNPDGYLGQAEVLLRRGCGDEAIELYEKAMELVINSAVSDSSRQDDSSEQGDSSVQGSSSEQGDSSVQGSSLEQDDMTETTSEDGSLSTADDNDPRYNSGIKSIFLTTESDINKRIEELSSDTYSDSTGRVRYMTIYGEDGSFMESIFYACYLYGEEISSIIVSYNSEGSMLATVFDFYEDTDQYVYGMYTSSDIWNVCIPMWSEDGTMTGIKTYYGGSVIAYDMYLYDSVGTMIGTEQYNSS